MSRRFILLASIVIGLLSVSCQAAELKLTLVTPDVLTERLRAGLVGSSKRQSTIRQIFESTGCSVEEQQVSHGNANVVCTLKGESESTVIVGGHFDFVDHGKGIVDDWSGTSLLPSLYQTLKTKSRHHTFKFVAFAEEEKGLVGSKIFVDRASAGDLKKIQAFINLECLGVTPPKVWVHRSTPLLVSRMVQIANSTKIQVEEVDVEKVGDDDTHPFLLKNVPVISIHSITQETFGILHSNRDNIDAIQPQTYYSTYKLLAFYLAYLDDVLSL